MTRHEPFGQCLQRILRQEGWSATKLVGLLGYKSRNSLFRILKDQASYEAQAAFLESLRGADVPWLASYEAKLEDALELRNYLYQLQEQLEYVLSHLDTENMNEEFVRKVNT